MQNGQKVLEVVGRLGPSCLATSWRLNFKVKFTSTPSNDGTFNIQATCCLLVIVLNWE